MGHATRSHPSPCYVPAGLEDFAELFIEYDLRSYYRQNSLWRDKNRSLKQQTFRHICNELTKRPVTYRLATVTEEAQDLQDNTLLFDPVGNGLWLSAPQPEEALPPNIDFNTSQQITGPLEETRRNIMMKISKAGLSALATRSSFVAAKFTRRARASTARLRAHLTQVGSRVKDVAKLKRTARGEEDEQRLAFALLDSASTRGVPDTKLLVKKILQAKPKLSEERDSCDGVFEWVPSNEGPKHDLGLVSLGSFRARRSGAPSPSGSLNEHESYGILSKMKIWNLNVTRPGGEVVA